MHPSIGANPIPDVARVASLLEDIHLRAAPQPIHRRIVRPHPRAGTHVQHRGGDYAPPHRLRRRPRRGLGWRLWRRFGWRLGGRPRGPTKLHAPQFRSLQDIYRAGSDPIPATRLIPERTADHRLGLDGQVGAPSQGTGDLAAAGCGVGERPTPHGSGVAEGQPRLILSCGLWYLGRSDEGYFRDVRRRFLEEHRLLHRESNLQRAFGQGRQPKTIIVQQIHGHRVAARLGIIEDPLNSLIGAIRAAQPMHLARAAVYAQSPLRRQAAHVQVDSHLQWLPLNVLQGEQRQFRAGRGGLFSQSLWPSGR